MMKQQVRHNFSGLATTINNKRQWSLVLIKSAETENTMAMMVF